MAVINFDESRAAEDHPRPVRIQGLVNLAGAAVSIVLVVGVGIWGYRLAERDVNGVPVIKALKGPMRIAPQDPGGQIAGNIGLEVNRVAAGTPDQGGQASIALAPAATGLGPQDLSPDAQAALKAREQAAAAAAAPVPPAAGQAGQGSVVTPGPTGQPAPGQGAGQAAQQTGNAAPATSGQPTATQMTTAQAPATAGGQGAAASPAAGAAQPAATGAQGTGSTGSQGTAPGTAPLSPASPEAVAQSIRPAPRPAAAPQQPGAVASADTNAAVAAAGGGGDALSAAIASAISSVSDVAATPATMDPAKLAPGTRLVQLGAFDSADAARARWQRLEGQFGAVMADKARVIESAVSGGRRFYRLRAYGFGSDAEARRFCSVLLAENTSCVPVVVR